MRAWSAEGQTLLRTASCLCNEWKELCLSGILARTSEAKIWWIVIHGIEIESAAGLIGDKGTFSANLSGLVDVFKGTKWSCG